MQVAETGPWELGIPDGWSFKDHGTEATYLEAPDGTRGCYIKTIELQEPKASAEALSEYLQRVHEESFRDATSNTWKVVARRGTQDGEFFRSELDLLDKESTYRVLSLVVSSAQYAVQVNVHDYLCQDYEGTKGDFASMAASVRWAASAA
jgi:hypothetical protein